MAITRIYDWAGVLVDIGGWKKFFREYDSDLYNQYEIAGQQDHELRKRVRPKVLEMYEDAVANARFDTPLFYDASARLTMDRDQGNKAVVFTSSPPAPFEKQINQHQLGELIHAVVFLEEIQKRFGESPLTKEDPVIFREMMEYLSGTYSAQESTYVDDQIQRVEAASAARSMSPAAGHLKQVYHLDRKALSTLKHDGYITINGLLSI